MAIRKETGVTEEKDTVILKKAMKERGLVQVTLAERLGMQQSSLCGNLNRSRIGMDVFRSILDAMGYDVVIVDRETGEAKWKVKSGE